MYVHAIIHPSIEQENAFANADLWYLCRKKNKEATRMPAEKLDFHHARLRTLLISSASW
jgi:hypothetical protein